MLNDMRYRIKFQKKKEGGRLPVEGDYETVVECWAKAEGLKGREYYAAAAVQKEHTVEFTIRHREDIDKHMRILFQNQSYEIESILPNYSRKNFTTIKAKAVE